MNILEATGVAVHRGGARVLDIPAFSLPRGGRMALVGPNGAGKTTLLLTLAGLIQRDAGSLSLNGQPVSDLLAYRRRISAVFQQPMLFDRTVRENIAAGLTFRHMPASEVAGRVRLYAERFGIAHLLDRSARKLSGGEAQRTSLARGFAIEPEILFLDEPFAALDRPTRESVIHDLQRVLHETGMSALFATHDQDEALLLSDELAVTTSGRIVQSGRTEDVVNYPADPFVASFLGAETIVPGRVIAIENGCLRVSIGSVEIEAVGEADIGAGVTLCIRPESVTLSNSAAGATSSARNTFRAKILRVIPRRHYCRIELDAGFFLVASVTLKSREELELAEGRTVMVSFKATAVHMIPR
jgi:tungstate transport system ATP-binding protein